MYAQTPDLNLLSRWVEQRDAEAFHEITRRHAAMVYATARRVLQDAVEAEDVAQECFESLLKAECAPQSHLPAWLHRVAVNRSISRLRKRGREGGDTSSLNGVPAPLESAERAELHRMVDAAIEELPEPLRLVLVEHFLQGRTHDDIARSLDLDRSTITRRIQKALEDLRERLRVLQVAVPGAALVVFLEAEAAAASPPALSAALGRLALSGVTRTTALPAAGSLAGLVKIAVALVVVAGGFGGVALARKAWAPTEKRAALAPVAPVTVPEATRPAFAPAAPVETSREPQVQLAANTQPGLPAAGVPPSEGRAITGQVMDVSTGGPAAGVPVVAAKPGPKYVAETITDAQGKFTLTRVPPGIYEVQFPSFNITRQGDGFRISARYGLFETPRSRNSVRVTVSADQDVAGIALKLDPGVLVEGVVKDSAGKPVAEAKVTGYGTQLLHQNETTSHQDGTFSLRLPPDMIEVIAETDTALSPLQAPQELGEESLRGLEVKLSRKKNCALAGTVVDAAGRPVPNVQVQLWPEHYPQAHQILWQFGRATTAGNGTFRIAGIPADTYGLILSPAGSNMLGKPTTYQEVKEGQTVTGVRVAMENPPASSPATAPRSTVARATKTDAGKVVPGSNSIRGQVFNTSGRPIQGRVHLMDNSASSQDSSVSTDAQGRFSFGDLEEAEFWLAAMDFANPLLESEPVQVELGATDVRLVVPAMHMWEIKGKVIDKETGKPVTKFSTNVVEGPSKGRIERMMYGHLQECQAPDGAFGLSTFWPQATVLVTAEGYQPAYRELARTEYQGEILEFALQEGQEFKGLVVDPMGRPVSGARIYLGNAVGPDSHRQKPLALSARDGEFTIDPFDPGMSGLVAEKPGVGMAAELVRDGLRMVLQPVATLRVTILRGGVPVPQASMTCSPKRNFRLGANIMGSTDATGTAVLNGVIAGKISLHIWMDKQFVSRQEELQPGVQKDLILNIPEEYAQVTSTVIFAGTPLWKSQVKLCVNVDGWDFFASGMTDQAGTYTFDQVPPGEGMLRVMHRDEEQRWEKQRFFVLEPDAVVAQEIDLSSGAAVQGQVRGRKPGSKVWVTVLQGQQDIGPLLFAELHNGANRNMCCAMGVDQSNQFSFGGLDAGLYTVVAEEFPSVESSQRSHYVTKVVQLAEGQEMQVNFELK